QEEIDEITAEIFTYDPQKMLLANRDSENRIEEIIIFGIYNPNPKRPAQKFYKTGLRNFSKAKISIIKTQKGKPMVSLKDPIGDAIWTDKLDQQTVSLKVGDKADKLIAWIKLQQQKGAEVAIEEIDVDPSNGDLLSYKLNKEGPQGDQAIYLPSAETILYSGEGNVFFMTSHALPRIANSTPNQEQKTLKEFPPQLLNQVASPPVWVFLDDKHVGSFESSDGLKQALIDQGIITSPESIGQSSYYSIQNGDLTELLDAEHLAPPSQGLDSLPEIFNVYILNTWEHLAEKFSQEGPQKHRLYFFGENRIGFRKGLIEEVVREISSEQQASEESVSVKIYRGSEAEKKYKIQGIEVVEISNESNEQFNPEENRADIIRKLILSPQTSRKEFSQFSQLVQDNLHQRPRVTRGQNGQIQSFYMIYEEGHRIYKMGISDFKRLDLILRKEEDGRVIFDWATDNQDNIWTREMDHQYVQIFSDDPIEKLSNWMNRINNSYGSGLKIVDTKSENGALKEITVSQANPGGANVAQSTIPTEVSILYDEMGNVFSFGVKTLDPNHKEDISKLTFLNTYPTNVNTYPDKEAIEIVMKVQSQLLADVKIIDLSGKVFFEEKGVQFGPQTIALLISIANCSNGIYFANIQTSDGQLFNKKFVIKR
ncbi:MAG: T9SS type A sorting domain-containing protein, partial [Bacteroidota bacterium]